MNEKLIAIKAQMENLRDSINEYLESNSQETIIINKSDFQKIKHLGKLNSYVHVFEFDNYAVFTLPNSSSYGYEFMHYKNLMSGELERIILYRKSQPYTSDKFVINFNLEEQEKTKLRDLYSNSQK